MEETIVQDVQQPEEIKTEELNPEVETLRQEIEKLNNELGDVRNNLVKAIKQRDEANKAFLSSASAHAEEVTFAKLMEDIA